MADSCMKLDHDFLAYTRGKFVLFGSLNEQVDISSVNTSPPPNSLVIGDYSWLRIDHNARVGKVSSTVRRITTGGEYPSGVP